MTSSECFHEAKMQKTWKTGIPDIVKTVASLIVRQFSSQNSSAIVKHKVSLNLKIVRF